MTDMDIENIFNLFNHNKKEEPKETPPTVIEMEQFEKTPTYKIGMFKRIILNQSMFSKKIISMFKDSDDEFETEDLEDMSEYLAHHRAWSYIKDCDIDSELWNGSLVIQHDNYLDTSIKLERLSCHNNKLTYLNVENLLQLELLYCKIMIKY